MHIYYCINIYSRHHLKLNFSNLIRVNYVSTRFITFSFFTIYCIFLFTIYCHLLHLLLHLYYKLQLGSIYYHIFHLLQTVFAFIPFISFMRNGALH